MVAGLAACTSDTGTAGDGGTWTVLTYEIADTDLEPFMMTDVAEMGEVGGQDGFSLISLVDRADGYTDESVLGLDDWVGGKLLELTDGGAEELDDLGDINTGDPQVLADFITRGFTDYPADNYALIISDHGASWPGVGADESSDEDSLSLAEIGEGIATGLAGADIPKLDLLGFDACLMATYEVASALAPLADRMLASQELEPGHGWDYASLQPAAEGADVDELGSSLIAGFEAQAQAEDTQSEITLSLVDLTRMTAVDDALATLTSQLVDRAASVSPVVGRTLASTLGFGKSPDPEQDSSMTDLAMLAGEIGVDALDVSDATDDLVRAVNDAVVDKVDGQATRGATGLSIYFPPQSQYFDESYRELEVAGGWTDFLSNYYGEGAAIPVEAQAQFATGDAEVSFDEEGLTITGTFDSATQDNLASSHIRYGIVEDDGSVTYVGEEPAEISDDGSGLAVGVYDLTTLTISDGEDTATAYLQLTTAEDGSFVTFDVPMAYYAADDVEGETYQDAPLSIVLDGETGDITSETYYSYDETSGNYGELTADTEGIIVPQVLNVTPDGAEEWISTSDTGLYADLPSLEYDLPDLEPGTAVYIELWVTDFGGNSDMVSATVTVP
nr:clostripain-related cysteine peptidase [Conyzicola lurida]